MMFISFYDVIVLFVDKLFLLTFVLLIVQEIINIFYPFGINKKRNIMHPPRNETYFKVFDKFLSQPKQKTSRKGSFEYMEMAGKHLQSVVAQVQNFNPEPDNAEEKEQKVVHDGEYLECIDTSQSNINYQKQEKPHSFEINEDLKWRDLSSENFLSYVNEPKVCDDEILLSTDVVFPSSPFPLSLSSCSNQLQQMQIYNNYDIPPYQPSLSRIEESDETSGSTNYQNKVVNESSTDFDSDAEEDSSSSCMFRTSLSKVSTFDDLRQIDDENASDEEVTFEDENQITSGHFIGKEAEVSAKQPPDTEQNDIVCAIPSRDNPLHSDNLISEETREANSNLENLDRSDDPPVLVVDSLEEYLRGVEDQRLRSRKSSHASMQSNVTSSSYFSRDKTNQLHHSTPDIAGLSIYDDVDNHYLPVSYAGVKVKRKNWIKRSVSNAQDGYYFCGEKNPTKIRTLKKQLVRKLSKKYRSCESIDGAIEPVSKSPGAAKQRKKFSRKSNIRSMVGRFIRQIRRHDNHPKKTLRESTWSLPTNLDNSCSSSYGDYSVTDSEITVDR